MMSQYTKEPNPARAVTTALVAVLVLAAVVPLRAADGPDPQPAAAAGDSIREPLFAFLVGLAEGDSLGSWTGDDLADFVASGGLPSRFPLERIRRVERRRPTEEEGARWPVSVVRAIWIVELDRALDRPMPYSILGYHPGSLRVAGRLILTELDLGTRSFRYVDKEQSAPVVLNDILALRLETGWVILDADGWLDAMLGGALDDAWTLGFALARQDAGRIGLAVSVKRDGGSIFGEFDFVADKVMKAGAPLAKGLSRFCRGWFTRPETDPPPVWLEEDQSPATAGPQTPAG